MDKDEFLENVSFLLGMAHGTIGVILQSPDTELRGKLSELKQMLDARVSKLYYEPNVEA